MTTKVQIFFFTVILCIGLLLRFYKLGSIPNGLYQDETAIGYNAYSLLLTGKDEYSKKFPLYFKSFGDYKMPVYIYATVPSIKFFGLTPFAVRFPSALFGFLTIPLLYLVIKTLSKNDRLAFVASLLLAVNPWHIHYSRATFEVTLALFLLLLGTSLLHKAYEGKSGYFLGGTLCFLLGFYSYNLTRLLVPILYLATLHVFHKKGIIGKLEAGTTLVLILAVLFPFIKTLLAPGGVGSAGGTLIFTSAAVQAPLLELRSHMLALPPLITKMLFNSYVLTTWTYLANIASYFSVPFFFISGSSHGNHGIGNVGQFYLFELPLIITGICIFLKEKTSIVRVLLVWLISSIAVASLTRESPHATRSFFLLFPLIVFSAKGVLTLYGNFLRMPKTPVRQIATVAIVFFVLYNMLFYLSSYFIRFPVVYAKSWRARDDDVSHFIRDHQDEYDKIIIDRNSGFIYTSFLFYTAFPPGEFQQSVLRFADDSEGFSDVSSFGKFEIRDVHEDDFRQKRTLVITSPDKKPTFAIPTQTFIYPQRPVVLPVKGEIISYPVQEEAYVAIMVD